MSDRYVHSEYRRTREQAGNLVALGRHLVFGREALAGRIDFGASLEVGHRPAGETRAFSLPLALGVAAGIAAQPGESLDAYMLRCFAVEAGSPAEDWIQGAHWWTTDPTPVGAALRMMYLLDYGTPWDWFEIMRGERESDYDDNPFLWERLAIVPPEA